MIGLKTAVRALLLLVILAPAASAGTRADHWSGIDLSVGEPFPSIAGASLGFNIGDDARLSAGLGTFSLWSTYALDAKFFAAPTQWSPYFGLGLSYMTGGHGTYLLWTLNYDHAFFPYFEVGMDFQSDLGIHVTFNLAGSAPGGSVIVLPGIAIGWYF